ncbi:hypothetical protein LMG7974_00593 [Campylobacter majalis]|uniref:Uncharacterized protein n=1 Tax=Campylobacter majalis TaxID=2790656 RepID=A0ABN7K5C2_9BACT|nr:hypothetical protein LMG7974_00593 [Campylobacter majalis]
MKSQIIIFQSEDKNISVDVLFENETVLFKSKLI